MTFALQHFISHSCLFFFFTGLGASFHLHSVPCFAVHLATSVLNLDGFYILKAK